MPTTITTTTTKTASLPTKTPITQKVAVIGTTGKLGREAILYLASRGIPTRCLLRHEIPKGARASMRHDAKPGDVAAFLAALSGVEMINGDVTDPHSISKLIDGCTACLALHGSQRTTKLSDLFPWTDPENNEPSHAKRTNYDGMANVVAAVTTSETCRRIVRVTGKGEDPWNVVSILINLLGGMAKAWNYEGEELLRRSNIDYTIIRPGQMVSDCPDGAVLALRDNGGSLPTSKVNYISIASLCVDCLKYDNTRRATLCAMNVPSGMGETIYGPLLERVRPDTRVFPKSLMREHRRAVRVGGVVVLLTFAGFVTGGVAVVRRVYGIVSNFIK